MTIRLVSDWQETYKRSIDALTGSSPVFYGRIGGSDTDMVIDYLEGRMAGERQSKLLARVLPHYERLTEYNGYYDKANDKKYLMRFCKLLLACYGSSTHASLAGKKWLTLYFLDSAKFSLSHAAISAPQLLDCEALLGSV